jgi:hypothetical protein
LIILFENAVVMNPRHPEYKNSDVSLLFSPVPSSPTLLYISTSLTQYPEHYNVFEIRLCTLSRRYLPRHSTASASDNSSWWYVLLEFMPINHIVNQTNAEVNANVNAEDINILSNKGD